MIPKNIEEKISKINKTKRKIGIIKNRKKIKRLK